MIGILFLIDVSNTTVKQREYNVDLLSVWEGGFAMMKLKSASIKRFHLSEIRQEFVGNTLERQISCKQK